MPVPSGHVFGDTFYGFFGTLTAVILQSQNPITEAEMVVAELKHVAATGDFDHIQHIPHLRWLHQHLPNRRELWPLFIDSVLVMVLAILVWAKTCPTDIRQTTIQSQALIDSCRAITACGQLATLVTAEAWSRADPSRFLSDLSNKIRSMNTPAALHRACETTLTWLKPIVTVTPERAAGWFDEAMIFFVIPWLCLKWKKRNADEKSWIKPPKPDKAEIDRSAREAWEEYGKSQGWWK